MSGNKKQMWSNGFLDVTQFILTDPRQKVSPTENKEIVRLEQNEVIIFFQQTPTDSPIKNWNSVSTPINLPLVIQAGTVQLSPFFKDFLKSSGDHSHQFFDFSLEGTQTKKSAKRCNNTNELIEEQEDDDDEQQSEDEQQVSEQQLSDDPDSSQKSKFDQEIKTQSIIASLETSKLNLHYFRRSLASLKNEQSQELVIRQFLQGYLTEQDLLEQQLQNQQLGELIIIAENNLRPIGPISWLERKHKVNKYIQKKKRRSWRKTISYDCRKRVADGRLRVKGKFVTRDQVLKMLGLEACTDDQLKQLIELKLGKSTQI